VLQLESNRVIRAEGHRYSVAVECVWVPQSKSRDSALDIIKNSNREVTLGMDLHHPEGWLP
jgi:hypothetical protein